MTHAVLSKDLVRKLFTVEVDGEEVADAVTKASSASLEPGMELVFDYDYMSVDRAIEILNALKEYTTYIDMHVHSNFKVEVEHNPLQHSVTD